MLVCPNDRRQAHTGDPIARLLRAFKISSNARRTAVSPVTPLASRRTISSRNISDAARRKLRSRGKNSLFAILHYGFNKLTHYIAAIGETLDQHLRIDVLPEKMRQVLERTSTSTDFSTLLAVLHAGAPVICLVFDIKRQLSPSLAKRPNTEPKQ